MLGLNIFVRVQTFRRRPFVPLHNFCHPVDHNAFDYGGMPVHLSYQPHLYRDRTRTKVLCRKLSATFSWWSPLSTLPRVSPSRYPKVSWLKDGNAPPSTISGAYKTDRIVFMVTPKCPYFLKKCYLINWAQANTFCLDSEGESSRGSIGCWRFCGNL